MKLYGSDQLVKDFFRPYLYLDGSAIQKKGLDRDTVAAALAADMAKQPGVGGAIPAREAARGNPTGAAAAVKHNHHPLRAGDIYIFQRPYWFMFDRGAVAAMHGSPWAYDTHVPIMFAGPGIRPNRLDRLVHPVDVAPTLSALLGILPPAAAQGEVLGEVAGQ
jgi:hypothetical protein